MCAMKFCVCETSLTSTTLRLNYPAPHTIPIYSIHRLRVRAPSARLHRRELARRRAVVELAGAADALARYHRMRDREVTFVTGTDEHGQKVQQAADKRGVEPKVHCDEMAPRFLELWDKLNIKYDDFIRTTESRHVSVVQVLLQKVYDKG